MITDSAPSELMTVAAFFRLHPGSHLQKMIPSALIPFPEFHLRLPHPLSY